MKKVTKAEKAQRIAQVVEFLLDGASRNHIVQYGSKGWSITSRQVDDYIAWANQKIIEIADEAEKSAFGKVRSRLERLYFKAMGKGDLKLARNVLKDMRDLYGMDKPTKFDHSGRITHEHVAVDEARRAVKERLDRLLTGNGTNEVVSGNGKH